MEETMPPQTVRVELALAILNLPPSYFAMVMATGTLSIAAQLHGIHWLAWALFGLNLVFYVTLIGLYAARLIRHPRLFFADLISHERGSGFFTSVASSCIVGSQCILIAHSYAAAIALWVIAILLWLGLTYTIFTAFTIKENKPALAESISGAWLLAVVATQAIAVLSALIAAHWPQPLRLELNFFALSMWLWGGMLYIWMISLIFYRYTFFRFSPGDLSPPYWINMGAMAISTLAGARLIENTPDAPYLESLLPILKGFTVFYWATGTWWIPMLVILGFWRYVYKGHPFEYDPLYWGAVFPLAMYTVCTYSLAKVMHLDFLYAVPRGFIFIAMAAWGATFTGLLRRIVPLMVRVIQQ
jgi:tellurite resistance protein TehA-like permease